jgi:hypothetical protein
MTRLGSFRSDKLTLLFRKYAVAARPPSGTAAATAPEDAAQPEPEPGMASIDHDDAVL